MHCVLENKNAKNGIKCTRCFNVYFLVISSQQVYQKVTGEAIVVVDG